MMLMRNKRGKVTFGGLEKMYDMEDFATLLWVEGAERWSAETSESSAGLRKAFDDALDALIDLKAPDGLAFGAFRWAFGQFSAGWKQAALGAAQAADVDGGNDTRELS